MTNFCEQCKGPCKRSKIELVFIKLDYLLFSYDFANWKYGELLDNIQIACQTTFHRLYCWDNECISWTDVRDSWKRVVRK